MEAVPRLPMISFETKTSTEIVTFGSKLKQYISSFYNEDPESYNNEIHMLEALRAGAVRPSIDISGCQMLKKYYCQLHFLKSRFPMEDGQPCSVYFSWRDNYSNMVCSVADIDFELMNILFDIGAVHTKLGALDSRVTPDGMKLACTHFQCAAWAFQTVREVYPQMVSLVLAPEVIHFMHLTCLAQAQECILEKSMTDNRKATIIAKVAVQVVDYYKQSLSTLQTTEDGSLSDLLGSKTYKDWIKYLNFKILYHKAISFLYLGQQAEEQQKMGERVAFYQVAADILQEASKKSSNLPNQQEINEALAFTSDVIEGKKKAAKNENEFIYHEEVPDKDALPEVKGASLVKGIAFSVNDTDVSGTDIFARLIPMEAHEASSLYSEKKANLLRHLGEAVENKDKALVEFTSSLQLEALAQMRQANGLTQDLVDRAAAMSARPTAIQDLVNVMSKLSNIYHDVESMLTEINSLIKEEGEKEKIYQAQMGKRPPSIIATDLTREYTKYQEAHSKACESNQNLHKAMTSHSANLKILSLPLTELKKQIPSIEFPNPSINEEIVNEMEKLISKIDEMKKQRAMLWAQYHDSVKNDDITSRLVTCPSHISKEQLFEQELQKHQAQGALIEQNMTAQDNILKALVDVYAKYTETRRYIQEVISKRNNMLAALNNSYDTYDDLLAKANKGLEFYNKLETNVSKLLQRIKSTCNVQDEEREQILAKQIKKPVVTSSGPKLKDYLEARGKDYSDPRKSELQSNFVIAAPAITNNDPSWPPGVRPPPVGSETNNENALPYAAENNYTNYAAYNNDYYNSGYPIANNPAPDAYSTNSDYYSSYNTSDGDKDLNSGMANLMSNNGTMEHLDYGPQSMYVYTTKSDECFELKPALQQQQQPKPSVSYAPEINSSSYYSEDSFTSNESSQVYQDPKQKLKKGQFYNPQTGLYEPLNNYPQDDNASYNSQYGGPTTSSYNDPNSYVQSNQQQNDYNALAVYDNTSLASYDQGTNTDVLYNNVYAKPNNPNQTGSSYDNSQNYGEYYNNYQQYISQVATSSPFTYNNQVGPYQSYSINLGEQLQNYNSVSQSLGAYSGITTTSSTESVKYPITYTQDISGNLQNSSFQTIVSNIPTTVYSHPESIEISKQPMLTKKETSNIDLLSGLDFSVNQAPLVPQPKKIDSAPKEIPVTKSVEPLPSTSLPKTNKMDELYNSKTDSVLKKHFQKNSFEDPMLIREFIQEVDKFDKFVDSLCVKTLNGPTLIETKWKEIQDKQEIEMPPYSISVARCYPMKNRFPDILPYDQTRVKLIGKKDDYINASHITNVGLHTPEFIITQSPLHNTYEDFWIMVCDMNVELIVCLLNDSEIGNDKYWPVQGKLSVGNCSISINKQVSHQYWIETDLTIDQLDKRCKNTVRHLQFRAWPNTLFPPMPAIVSFLNEILQHSNVLMHPLLIHCSAGIGRSGFLCLLLCAATQIITNPPIIPDLTKLAIKISNARKNAIRDQEHFRFAYQVFLYFLKDIIHSNNLNKKAMIGDAVPISSLSPPPLIKEEDPLSLLDPFWASRK